MKRNKIILAAVCLFCVLAAGSILLLRVTPKSSEFTIELGEDISKEGKDYLEGWDFLLERAALDMDQVDPEKVGVYEAYCHILFYDFVFHIKVEDTTAPSITPVREELCLEAGKEYAADYFFQEASDRSGEVNIGIVYNEQSSDTISFEEIGTYTLEVFAQDAFGNSNSLRVEVLVDEAPVFAGVHDRYLAVGSEIDVCEYVAAVDNLEGIVSDRIRVDTGGLDTDTIGDYVITYTVEDSYGLETSESAAIHICSADELAGYETDYELPEDELELLCDAGYFTYEPLTEGDTEEAVGLIRPALVNISGDFYSGSGFIYKITPQYVYFVSAGHVLEVDPGGVTNITFYDGESIQAAFAYECVSDTNELSMFRLDIAEIPAELLLVLKQACVDTDIYGTLSVGDEIAACATHFRGQDEDLVKVMEIEHLLVSEPELGLYSCLLVSTGGPVRGMSGTAVVDDKGNLVGIATAIDEENKIAYHTRIDRIKELEERLLY